jgi:hypothetical protein
MHRPSSARRLPRSAAHSWARAAWTARRSRRSAIENRPAPLNTPRVLAWVLTLVLTRRGCCHRCRRRRAVNRTRSRLRHNHAPRHWDCPRLYCRNLPSFRRRRCHSRRCFCRTRPLRCRCHDWSGHSRRCRRRRCLSCCRCHGPGRDHCSRRRNLPPIRRRSRTRRCRHRRPPCHWTRWCPRCYRRRLRRRGNHRPSHTSTRWRRRHHHVGRRARLRKNFPRRRLDLGRRLNRRDRRRRRTGRNRNGWRSNRRSRTNWRLRRHHWRRSRRSRGTRHRRRCRSWRCRMR